MMYTKDQPKIYINDCLVHSVRHSSETMEERLEMVEREKMFRIQAIKRERSASLPSADISVSSALISLKTIAEFYIHALAFKVSTDSKIQMTSSHRNPLSSVRKFLTNFLNFRS